MSPILLDIPDELAQRLQSVADDLPRILELGLRELAASGQPGFVGAAGILEFLAGLPSPEETLALRPSKALQSRLDELLEKNRVGELTPEEQQEWREYEYLEHLVRMAKANAALRLQPE